MLEAPPRKNNRYSPNPIPRSHDVYSSINQIKAAGGKHQSSKEGQYDPSLNMFLPSGFSEKLDAEEEKPHMYGTQVLSLPKVGNNLGESREIKKSQNDGYWDEAGQQDSEDEGNQSPIKQNERNSKRVKLLEVDEEEVNQKKDKKEEEEENGLQIQALAKGKEFQGMGGEDNIDQINQKAFQDMMEERKESALQMEILRKFTDQEEFKRVESNLQEEQDNDIEDIRKECMRIKMSDKFESSRSKITESQLQNMIDWHIRKEYGSGHEEKKLREERNQDKQLLGGKEKLRMTYENGSVKIKREVMESPVVALKFSGGETILTNKGQPIESEAKREEVAKVEESDLIKSTVKKSGILLSQNDNKAAIRNTQPKEEEKEERKEEGGVFSTPGKVELVTKAQVTQIGKSKPHIEDLRVEDVNLQIKAKADNQGGMEAADQEEKGHKKPKIKRGKNNMKNKGGCCGSSSCSIF